MSHGAGCGAQAGAVAGVIPDIMTPGNGVKPLGLPMPLVNGV